jgi:Holliday junction resolvase RusA-like endonuclease
MMIAFTIVGIPPSVNHYKVRYRNGRTVVSKEAIAFKDAVGYKANGKYVTARSFYVDLRVTLGRKDKGDADNFPKVVLDGLADAGVFRDRRGARVSDAHVRRLVVVVDCDTRPAIGETRIEVGAWA